MRQAADFLEGTLQQHPVTVNMNDFRTPRDEHEDDFADVKGQEQAIQTHNKVGKEVRDAIKRIGGTLPENIPSAEHIKVVQKRIKDVKPRLQLDDKNAKGLIGGTE